MSFKIGANTAYSDNGIPFLWGSGDQTTAPSGEVKIQPSDPGNDDEFGNSISIGHGRVVVGSPLDDDNGSGSGSAYIYNLSGTQLAKIKASDAASSDNFGNSVAIGCGRIVVGAYGDADNGLYSGSAYIFNTAGTQLAKIKASDGASSDYFGLSVAVGSGRIVVGAYGDDDNGTDSGSAYIFDLNGTQLAKIKPSGRAFEYFGLQVAVGCGRIVVGAYDGIDGLGRAYLFDLSGTRLATLTAANTTNDRFGRSVAIGSGRIVVGAPYDDDNGSDSGSAFIFDLNGNELTKIKASDGASEDFFGNSVSVGSGRVVVGAYGDDDNGSFSGSMYIYDLNGRQIAKIKPSDGANPDFFGISVTAKEGIIAVGAINDSISSTPSGSAYIFNTPHVYTPYDVADLNSYGQ
jgi:hypothetical protein